VRQILVVMGCLLFLAQAHPQSEREILRRASLFGRAANTQMSITMQIVKPQGTKARTLEAFVRRRGTASQILLHIVSPAFLSQMKFLSDRDEKGRESKWLKTSSGVRRLSEGNRAEPLFDSDFTVEDLSEIYPDDFDLTLLGDRRVGPYLCDLIEAVPRFAGSSYSKKWIYVEKDSGILCAVDFFGRNDQLIKRYRLTEVQTLAGGTYPLSCRMESVSDGTHTELGFPRIDIMDSLPDKLFSRASL
jgi:hypothetical protein